MLMTVDGTNDGLICIDGVEKYTFTDADAGDLPVNERSDDDDDDDDDDDEEEEEAKDAGGQATVGPDGGSRSKNRLSPLKPALSQNDLKCI